MSSTAIAPSSPTVTTANLGRSSASPLSAAKNATLPSLRTAVKTAFSPTSSSSSTPRQGGQRGWIHPRMDEVIRRRNKTNFDSTNMKTIVISAGFLLASLFAPSALQRVFPPSWAYAMQPWPMYALWFVRLLFALMTALAAAPLLRAPDDCEDVPLTSSQRQLLGLPPMSRPATPQEQEQYVTPPRFSRSITPHSASSSVRAEAGGSPLSGRGTPMENSSFRLSESQSRGSQSPLWLSGFGSSSEQRRLSYTGSRGSSLSVSEFETGGSSGTPTKGNRASVGLNNKWLYEKSKSSPKGFYASRGPSFM